MPEPTAEGPTYALSVEDVSHSYGRKRALDRVSLDVRSGGVTALLGPNGAGKTTLFALITRLLRPQSGRITLCGVDLGEAGARALAPLGTVFQQPTLDLDLTVRQNLRYFARLRGLSSTEAETRIERELARLDMAERAGERVRALNGGHRRRVEIARALLHDPQLLLLDEPTVGLDVPSRKAIVSHVHALSVERKLGVLWATHLIDEVWDGDDLVVLHQGRVVARGLAGEVTARTGTASLDEAFSTLTREAA